MPNTLKRLTLFEDFNEDFNGAFQGDSILYGELVRTANPSLGTAVTKTGLFLERLSASFLIDAKDSTEDPTAINNILHAAGVVARIIPKLRIIEIWSGGKGQASVFRYHATDDFTTVT